MALGELSPVTLQAGPLFLRPVVPGDAAVLAGDMADEEVSRYMAWRAHASFADTERFVELELERRTSGRGITWLIFRNQEFCGIVSLIALLRRHRALRYDRAELAYWLARRARGSGIMTEACLQVLEYAFGALSLHKIVVSHCADNLASRRLIERLGFRYVGQYVDDFEKDGTWHDHRSYELLGRDFNGPLRRDAGKL